MVTMSTPFMAAVEAQLWRRSCSRRPGKPASARMRSHWYPMLSMGRVGGRAGKRYGQSGPYRGMASITARAALDSQTVRGPDFESGRWMRLSLIQSHSSAAISPKRQPVSISSRTMATMCGHQNSSRVSTALSRAISSAVRNRSIGFIL